MKKSSLGYPVIAGAVMTAAVTAACAATMPIDTDPPHGTVYGPEPPNSIELLIRNTESGIVAGVSVAAVIASVKTLYDADKAIGSEDLQDNPYPPVAVPPVVQPSPAVITEEAILQQTEDQQDASRQD